MEDLLVMIAIVAADITNPCILLEVSPKAIPGIEVRTITNGYP